MLENYDISLFYHDIFYQTRSSVFKYLVFYEFDIFSNIFSYLEHLFKHDLDHFIEYESR